MPAALRAVASTTLVSTGSGSCNAPSGLIAGDVLVAFHSVDEGSLADMGTPTGGETWLALDSRTTGDGSHNLKTKLWWKVAGGSEPGSFGFTQANGRGCIAIAAISGAAFTEPVHAQTGATATTATVATPSLVPAGIADVELRWAAGNTEGGEATWSPPATYTKRTDQQAGQFISASLASKALTSGAATGVQNFTTSGSLTIFQHGFTVAVTSALVPVTHRPVTSRAASHRAANW